MQKDIEDNKPHLCVPSGSTDGNQVETVTGWVIIVPSAAGRLSIAWAGELTAASCAG